MSDYRIPSWMLHGRKPESIEQGRRLLGREPLRWMVDPEEDIVAHIVRVENAARDAKVILHWTTVPYLCSDQELRRIIDVKKSYHYQPGDYLPHFAVTLLTAIVLDTIEYTVELRSLHGYYYWTAEDVVLGMRRNGDPTASPYHGDVVVTRFGSYDDALAVNVRFHNIIEREMEASNETGEF